MDARKLASFAIPTRDNSHQYQCNNPILLAYVAHAMLNIYIFTAIVFDGTSMFVAVYFSMQTIYQSYDLIRVVRRSNVDASL